MIVPMKKVSLIIQGEEKIHALEKLRKLGIIQIEISEGRGEKLASLKEQIVLLERTAFIVGKGNKKKQADFDCVIKMANKISALVDEKKSLIDEKSKLSVELNRLKDWTDLDPEKIDALSKKGVNVLLYLMPKSEYRALGEDIKTVRIGSVKSSVKFVIVRKGENRDDQDLSLIEK